MEIGCCNCNQQIATSLAYFKNNGFVKWYAYDTPFLLRILNTAPKTTLQTAKILKGLFFRILTVKTEHKCTINNHVQNFVPVV